MSTFDPNKLSVEFRNGVTNTEPITPRKYTLTHSDQTAELFLTIGLSFAYDKINPIRDEVFAEWVIKDNLYYCYTYLNVDGLHGSLEMATKRNEIFRRELPLALQAIRYGDQLFFNAYPDLDYSQIIVFFMSAYPQLNKIENWGTFSEYNNLSSL
ncbi:MAG: hypothetical protein K0R71_2289 [Bacillales bacterium]|jgi:hypothetical protein|nr:hypothetical protein [Bacillales bacterium]